MANSIIETDVAIIGGGGAGIPAAIEVARAGSKALVLEGAPECGGTAASGSEPRARASSLTSAS